MPENPSQLDTHTQSNVSELSGITAEEIKKKITENGKEQADREETEKDNTTADNEVRNLTVESEGRKNGQQHESEKAANAVTPDLDGSQAPRAPENLNTESTSEDSGELDDDQNKKQPRPGSTEKKPRPSRGEDVEKKKRPLPSAKKQQRPIGKTESGKNESSSDSQETHKDESAEKNEVEEQMSLTKVMSGGDPVLPYNEENFDDPRGGAWFLAEDANPDDSNNPDSEVEVIYKLPNNEVAERKMVSWLELIPTYDSGKEYTQALRTIREKIEQVKEQGGNEVYEKHLAKLGVQTAYAALLFNEKEKEKIKKAKAARNAA